VLQVRRSVWRRREQAPKTLNAIWPVDIPEAMAQVLCRCIKGRKGAPIHDESWAASGLAQCPGCVAASGETRRKPRVSPLSFCGTPQGGDTGRPHQTVARPLAKLNRPLRSAIKYDETYRRELCEKAGLGFELGELGDKSEDTNSHSWRKTMLKQGLEMVAGSDLN
jgi:hypothetical protein